MQSSVPHQPAKRFFKSIIVTVPTAFIASFSFAQESIEDTVSKKFYNLFNPVPRSQMKEMETDRPDVTESAYTVAPGHFQMESDLLRYTRNKNSETINTSVAYNVGNYKLGLSQRADIQLVVPTYISNSIRERPTNKIVRRTGFDDITLRFKYNFWGYKGGKTALAALPFISFPTSTLEDNGVQGGIVLPFAWQINQTFNFGTQLEADIIKEADNNYHAAFLYSATCGSALTSNLSVFIEAVTTYSPHGSHADVYANTGIIYSVTSNFNIDAGLNYGLTTSADKIFFAGFSFRL